MQFLKSVCIARAVDNLRAIHPASPKTLRFCLVLLLGIATRGSAADGDDVTPWRQDQPPNKPYSVQEAITKMTVPEGFTVERVASEPDIVNPIAMCFDDLGRIWITESIEYPRKPAGVGRDRVKILEDTDADGRADKITVFAKGLNIPTGVANGYGGVWVLNAPDLLFLREKDGKEISREGVVRGFGRTVTPELPTSLTWGADGWLYGLNGVFNQCRIVSNNGREYKFNAALWRVHPRTHEFQIVSEGTSNPYGLAWDTEGSQIVSEGTSNPTGSRGTPKAARLSRRVIGRTITSFISLKPAITNGRRARFLRSRFRLARSLITGIRKLLIAASRTSTRTRIRRNTASASWSATFTAAH